MVQITAGTAEDFAKIECVVNQVFGDSKRPSDVSASWFHFADIYTIRIASHNDGDIPSFPGFSARRIEMVSVSGHSHNHEFIESGFVKGAKTHVSIIHHLRLADGKCSLKYWICGNDG